MVRYCRLVPNTLGLEIQQQRQGESLERRALGLEVVQSSKIQL